MRDSDTTVQLSRRRLLVASMTAGLAGALGRPALAQAPRRLQIGYVSPQTRPFAPLGEADKFVLGGIRTLLKDGLVIGGRRHPVQVVVRDSQSNPNRAGEVAADLILKEKIDIMAVGNTPETANPVSDQCELNEVPCVSS